MFQINLPLFYSWNSSY